MNAEEALAEASTPPSETPNGAVLADLVGPGRRRVLIGALFITAATGATAAGYFAIASVAQDVLDGRTGWTHDAAWLTLLVAAAAARAWWGYAAAEQTVDGGLKIERSLRSRLLARILASGETLGSAEHATALLDEVDRIGAYGERYLPARLSGGLVPVMLLAVVFPLNWLVGVMLVLCTPLPPLNLSIVGMGTAGVARQHADELRHLSGYFLDRLRGMTTLRALGADKAELERVEQASGRLTQTSMSVLRIAFVSAGVLEAIVTMAMAVVATYVGLTLLGDVHISGLPSHMSLRTGLFLLMITPLYFQPVRALAAAYHERAEAIAACEALSPLLEPETDGDAASGTPYRSTVRVAARPGVCVDSLTVTFPGRDAPALHDVSVAIQPGELVGINGPSGAGKSTLLRVLAGDLHPTTGGATIDGSPIAEIPRSAITWLGQHPYLFPGTLAENIALGRPTASIETVREAALFAGLNPLLHRLPDGLDTPVGEGGWGLSGGEAHRVSLARAILKRAPVMLLDEPTAHLDSASEAALSAVLQKLAQDSTMILATHSAALLALCDRVFVLDRGHLVDARATVLEMELA